MKALRICIVSSSIDSVICFRKELIQYMTRRNNVVYIFSPDYTDKTRCIIKEFGAIPINCELDRSTLNPFINIFATIRLRKKIKELNPDIVFSYFSKPVIFGTLAARLAKDPRITAMLEG